jgi:hypothetical protein
MFLQDVLSEHLAVLLVGRICKITAKFADILRIILKSIQKIGVAGVPVHELTDYSPRLRPRKVDLKIRNQ